MNNIINFADGQPSHDLFPINLNKELNINNKDITTFYHYSPKAGLASTRETFIKVFGGKTSHVDKCLITNGTLGGIELIIKSFKFKIMVIDEPTYADAIDIFRKYDIKIICIPRDTSGNIKFQLFEKILLNYSKKNINIGMYLIPTLNNPDGRCLTLFERNKITALVIKYHVYCMEDDAYTYLIDKKLYLPSLYDIAGNTQDHTIIRLLSLSKILMPGLRISFIEASKSIIDILLENKLDYGYSPIDCYITQKLLTNTQGINDSILLIKEKSRNCIKYLVDILQKNGINVNAPLGGYFLWINLGTKNISKLEEIGLKNNLYFTNGKYSFVNKNSNYIRICPMKLSEKQMKIGALKLIQSIKECQDYECESSATLKTNL